MFLLQKEIFRIPNLILNWPLYPEFASLSFEGVEGEGFLPEEAASLNCSFDPDANSRPSILYCGLRLLW